MYKKWIVLIVALGILFMCLPGCGQQPGNSIEATDRNDPTEATEEATFGPGVEADVFGDPSDNVTENNPNHITDEKDEVNRTESSPTEGATTPTEGTTNAPTEDETSPPSAGGESTDGNQDVSEIVTEYERYHSMSGEEQTAFILSFPTVEDFFAWLNNAKAEHERLKPGVEIGSGSVDLGGGNG